MKESFNPQQEQSPPPLDLGKVEDLLDLIQIEPVPMSQEEPTRTREFMTGTGAYVAGEAYKIEKGTHRFLVLSEPDTKFSYWISESVDEKGNRYLSFIQTRQEPITRTDDITRRAVFEYPSGLAGKLLAKAKKQRPGYSSMKFPYREARPEEMQLLTQEIGRERGEHAAASLANLVLKKFSEQDINLQNSRIHESVLPIQ